MNISDQRNYAKYLVIGSIAISVVIASVPSIPLILANNFYTTLFGGALIALALISEAIAAFTSFKFFSVLEHVVKGRKDLWGRVIISALVAAAAVIGNGSLVHIGLTAANNSLTALHDSQIVQAIQLEREDALAQNHIDALRSGTEGAVHERGVLSAIGGSESIEELRAKDAVTLATYTEVHATNPKKAFALRASAAAIQERPEYLLILAIFVLKLAELTVIFLASPISWYKSDGLNNEQRVAAGLKPRGRPRLVASN